MDAGLWSRTSEGGERRGRGQYQTTDTLDLAVLCVCLFDCVYDEIGGVFITLVCVYIKLCVCTYMYLSVAALWLVLCHVLVSGNVLYTHNNNNYCF